MHASDEWISKLAMTISQKCAPWCRSAAFQRFHRRHRLPPVHRLPPGGDLCHEKRRDFSCDRLSTRKMFLWPLAIRLWTRFSAIFFDTAIDTNVTIRLYSTTSLKSISLKWWLSVITKCLNCVTDQFNSVRTSKSRDQSFFPLIVNRLTAIQ